VARRGGVGSRLRQLGPSRGLSLGAAVSSFDPLTLLPALFLSPAGPFYSDLGTTPVTADGSSVRRWGDISGNGRHADAPNDSARGTLGVNGEKTWLTFDGTDDSMAFAGVACKPFSVFAAYRPATVSGTEQVLVSGLSAQKLKAIGAAKMRGGKELTYNWTASATALSAGTDYRIGLVYGTTGAATYYLNGASDGVADADVSDDTFSNVTLLGVNNAAGEFLNGRLYALLLFERALSAGEIASLNSWLAGVLP
jgi:hypothetical protein